MPPIDPARLLAGAEAARTQPEQSAEVIARALAAAPQDPEIRLAAYRFHFYNHDYDAALGHARALLGHAARRLNVATEWRAVAPGDAAFSAHETAPGLYMQALIAMGYCLARNGARGAGQGGRARPLRPVRRRLAARLGRGGGAGGVTSGAAPGSAAARAYLEREEVQGVATGRIAPVTGVPRRRAVFCRTHDSAFVGVAKPPMLACSLPTFL
ncbi:hypothetical protein [Salipiger abyssi]|uniref:hypothetical protein n=1 Tax=Salipiger abyssi TaxID=1250539 RepID=UPI001A8C45F0|nr:hypothetical protein [Salipiger abyssi]MBN9887945.1 hypothetical protein [Salipiger abyssi]